MEVRDIKFNEKVQKGLLEGARKVDMLLFKIDLTVVKLLKMAIIQLNLFS